MTESEFLDDERKAPTPPGCCKSSRGRDRLPKLEPRTPTTQGGRLLKAQSPGTAPGGSVGLPVHCQSSEVFPVRPQVGGLQKSHRHQA